MCYDRATLGTSELNALQFSLLFDNQRATIICRLLKSLKTSFAKDVLNRSSSGAKHRSLDNCFHHFSVFDDFDSIKRSFLETSFLQCMPRRVPSYNPMALRIWRKLKRMGITSLQGIFLSLVFWSLFICLTYFIYTESTRFLAKIEAKKFDLSKLSKLGPGSMVDNGTLLARNFRRFDALGLFKTYWNNNSAVEDLLNYVKRRTQNISSNIPG